MSAITVYAPGHWDYLDSYGLIACQLARHLTALGVNVNAVGMGNTVMDNQPQDIRTVTNRSISPSLGGIVLGYPTGYANHSSLLHCGPRVAITMFESSKIPASWVDPLNGMDAVIVPSWFCASVFKACGVIVPIHVVPLGVGEVYQYQARPKERPLTFLTFLDRGERKGGIVALQAFLRAFGDDPNYQLILKSRKPKVPLELLNTNIEVVQEDMSEEELYQLYLRADVLINPHKGEGFGLIPREFAASGGLALTTQWSGTVDGIEFWGFPLPYMLEQATWQGNKYLQGQDLGQWAKVDADRIAHQLRVVADSWDWYRTLLPSKAQAARSMCNWRTFAEQVLRIWKGAVDGYSTRAAAA